MAIPVVPGIHVSFMPTGWNVAISFTSTTDLLHGAYQLLDTRRGAFKDGTSPPPACLDHPPVLTTVVVSFVLIGDATMVVNTGEWSAGQRWRCDGLQPPPARSRDSCPAPKEAVPSAACLGHHAKELLHQ